MYIDADSLNRDQAFGLMSGVVVPRPIAWISTLSFADVANLAPFSCFTFVANDPPMLGVSIGRRQGRRKDTAANIAACGEFVVNVADASFVDAVHDSGIGHAPDVSEIALLGLRTAACTKVRPPRLADVPISMECRLCEVRPFGREGAEFFVGEVVGFHLRDHLLRDGKVATADLNPLCRIAGPNYAVLGRMTTLLSQGDE